MILLAGDFTGHIFGDIAQGVCDELRRRFGSERPDLLVARWPSFVGPVWHAATGPSGADPHVVGPEEARLVFAQDYSDARTFCNLLRAADGVISRVTAMRHIDILKTSGRPVVTINNLVSDLPFPSVLADDQAVGALAARYFLRRGFTKFAFFGDPTPYSAERCKGLLDTLKTRGIVPFVCPNALVVKSLSAELLALVRTKPEAPLAVFAANDDQAERLVKACRNRGISIPESIAVMGVGNDFIAAIRSHIPLSSVELPGHEIGVRAAALLVDLMSGATPPASPVRVAPGVVVTRASTSLFAHEDPLLRKAMAFIEENANRPIRVSEVVSHVGASQRTLENRFHKCADAHITTAIRAAHIERAKSLLVGQNLTIKETALLSGFTSASHFVTTFRHCEKRTPLEFQKSMAATRN